eukprot:m.28329 g.28329  ORF g.28329 m.28329 type:complete len:1258 (+) comp13589_c0_seq2:646-4419(+)
MESVDLEFLRLLHGDAQIEITPGFTKSCLDYTATVTNSFDRVRIDTLAEDTDATVCVLNDHGNRTVKLQVGKNDLRVVVQSADAQHERVYRVQVLRLSMSDATLSSLSLDHGTLNPPFSPRITHYSANVPAACKEILVIHDCLDPLIQKTINGIPTDTNLTTVPITSGHTSITVGVVATDGVTTGSYVIQCYREAVGCALIAAATDQISWMCPLCFSVPDLPTRATPDTQDFCAACLSVLTRVVKESPLTRQRLASPSTAAGAASDDEATRPTKNPRHAEADTDDKSSLSGGGNTSTTHRPDNRLLCLWRGYGCPSASDQNSIGDHAEACGYRPTRCARCAWVVPGKDLAAHTAACVDACAECCQAVNANERGMHNMCCPSAGTNEKIAEESTTISVQDWEMQLAQQTSASETDPAALLSRGRALLEDARQPRMSVAARAAALSAAAAVFAGGTTAPTARGCVALHTALGEALEALHVLRESHRVDDVDALAVAINADLCLIDQGSEHTKRDDIVAICILHAVDPKGPASDVLIALDAEYRKLLGEGNSFRADYVQSLYLWQLQQMTPKRAHQFSDFMVDDGGSDDDTNSDPATTGTDANKVLLARACKKFVDGAILAPADADCQFRAGRALVLCGRPDAAIQRFQTALLLDPAHAYVRRYLSITVLLCGGRADVGPWDVVAAAAAELLWFIAARTHARLGLSAGPGNDRDSAGEKWKLEGDSVVIKGFMATTDALVTAQSYEKAILLCQEGAVMVTRMLAHATVRGTATYATQETALLGLHLNYMRSLWGLQQERHAVAMCEHSTACALSLSAIVYLNPAVAVVLERLLMTGVKCAPENPTLCLRLGLFFLEQSNKCSFDSARELDLLHFALAALQSATVLLVGDSKRAVKALQAQPWWGQVAVPARLAPRRPASTSTSRRPRPSATIRPVRPGATPKRSGPRPPAAPLKAPGRSRGDVSSKGAVPRGDARDTRTSARATPAPALPAPRNSRSVFPRNKVPLPAIGTTATRRGQNNRGKAAANRGGTAIGQKSPGQSCVHDGCSCKPSAAPSHCRGGRAEHGRTSPNSDVVVVADFALTPSARKKLLYDAHIGQARVHKALISAARTNPQANPINVADATVALRACCRAAIGVDPARYDAYIELADSLDSDGSTSDAIDALDTCPVKASPDFDDAYIHGEVVRLLIREKNFADDRLSKHLIGYAKVNGWNSIEKEVGMLDAMPKMSQTLRNIYVGVLGKQLDDPAVAEYLKLRSWY